MHAAKDNLGEATYSAVAQRSWDAAQIGEFAMQVLKLMIAGASALLALFAFWLMPQQLSVIGFAARNREPNSVAYYLSLGAGIIGLANVLAVARGRNLQTAVGTAVVLLVLAVLSVYLYFATW